MVPESEFEIVLVPSVSLVSIMLVILMMMTSVTPKNVLFDPLGAILINFLKHVGLELTAGHEIANLVAQG